MLNARWLKSFPSWGLGISPLPHFTFHFAGLFDEKPAVCLRSRSKPASASLVWSAERECVLCCVFVCVHIRDLWWLFEREKPEIGRKYPSVVHWSLKQRYVGNLLVLVYVFSVQHTLSIPAIFNLCVVGLVVTNVSGAWKKLLDYTLLGIKNVGFSF
jgi:hypothetical protein